MAVSYQSHNIEPHEFRDLCEQWQRCRAEDLPGLFYAYDEDQVQTERIVSFYLSGHELAGFSNFLNNQIEKHRKKSNPLERCRLAVYLGLTEGYDGNFAPRDPHFCLIIQPYSPDLEFGHLAWRLNWDPNPSFPTNPIESPLSGRDAIPGAGAFLFAHHWLETEHYELSTPFESTAYHLGRRVKSFRFAPQETAAIAKDINKVKKAASYLFTWGVVLP